MEGSFLTETTIADILSDPSRTAFLLRMEPGIGPKSKFEIIAAVHDALEAEFGGDLSVMFDESHAAQVFGNSAYLERLEEFFEHWPSTDSNRLTANSPAPRGKAGRA